MKYSSQITTLLFFIFFSFSIISSSFASNFSDIVGHPYAESIKVLSSNEIVHGYPDGTYKPENKITRAEFLKIVLLTKYTEEEISKCQEQIFSDTSADAWYYRYICFGYKNDIISGYGDGTFGPNNNIYFTEGSKILVNVLIKKTTPGKGDDWHLPYWNALREKAALPYDIQDPKKHVKRGEMAFVIHMLLRNSLTVVPKEETIHPSAEEETEEKPEEAEETEKTKETEEAEAEEFVQQEEAKEEIAPNTSNQEETSILEETENFLPQKIQNPPVEESSQDELFEKMKDDISGIFQMKESEPIYLTVPEEILDDTEGMTRDEREKYISQTFSNCNILTTFEKDNWTRVRLEIYTPEETEDISAPDDIKDICTELWNIISAEK